MPVVDLGSPTPEVSCSAWTTPELLPCAVSGISSPEQITTAIDTASQVLWALSGRRFGACPVTVRPCVRRCQSEPWPTLRPTGYGYDPGTGAAWNAADALAVYTGCGLCADTVEDCGCTALSQVALPRPVDSVDSVVVDGVVLASSAYRVDDRRWLVRLDGRTWPTCQNYLVGLDAPGSFGVTYLRGRAVPAAGISAAGELACELVKASSGIACRLPSRVTQITRQGVSMAMLDPMDFLDKGLTGLYRVDLFLTAFNRSSLRRRGSVASPDTLRRRTRVVGT